MLAELTQKNLTTQGLPEAEALEILGMFREQLREIEISFEYTDILGNSQSPCVSAFENEK